MSTFLPDDIIVDILSRLPVKSLSRFKCVSKLWLALITHPRFAKIHLSQTKRQKLILSVGSSIHSVDLGTLHSIDLETKSSTDGDDDVIDVAATTLVFPGWEFCQPEKYTCYVGSCNGLLCVTSGGHLFVCNLYTKEYKQVSDPFQDLYFVYGFGYAESIDDYKFVSIRNKAMDIYSLRKDSWTRDHKAFRSNYFFNYAEGVALNGAIHWVGCDSADFEGPKVIIAFDLVDEKFKTLPLPNMERPAACCLRCLGRLGDHLCVFNHCNLEAQQCWVMKEYGVQTSWTKLFTVHLQHRLKPLCYLRDTETIMLVHYDYGSVVVYDSKNHKKRLLRVDALTNNDGWYCIGEDVYVESLVSPIYKKIDFEIEEKLSKYWFLKW